MGAHKLKTSPVHQPGLGVMSAPLRADQQLRTDVWRHKHTKMHHWLPSHVLQENDKFDGKSALTVHNSHEFKRLLPRHGTARCILIHVAMNQAWPQCRTACKPNFHTATNSWLSLLKCGAADPETSGKVYHSVLLFYYLLAFHTIIVYQQHDSFLPVARSEIHSRCTDCK